MYRFYNTLNTKDGYVLVRDMSVRSVDYNYTTGMYTETVACSAGHRTPLANIFAENEVAFVTLMGVTFVHHIDLFRTLLRFRSMGL